MLRGVLLDLDKMIVIWFLVLLSLSQLSSFNVATHLNLSATFDNNLITLLLRAVIEPLMNPSALFLLGLLKSSVPFP